MRTLRQVLLSALCLGWVAASRAAEPAFVVPDWIQGHLEIGTRVSYFMLLDDHRDFYGGNRFWGSINDLDVHQQYLPIKVFAAYKFTPYFGAELTVEQLRFATWSRPAPQDGTPWSDGTVNMAGPIVSLFGRYPNTTRFTPYAGVGLGYFFADFEYAEAWHHPPDYYDPTFYQDFRFDDTLAWLIYGGLLANLNDHWAVDFQVRYMKMSLDGVTMTSRDGSPYYENGEFTFPLSNVSFALGISYAF